MSPLIDRFVCLWLHFSWCKTTKQTKWQK